MIKKSFSFYMRLFAATFTLSAFTFGGGYVMVSLMRQKFVDKYQWLNEQEMLDITAVAQSSPGVIAVNASIMLGYRLACVPGTIVSMVGTVLPPFIVMAGVSVFYDLFRDNTLIRGALWGMQAGVAAVIVDVVISMAVAIVKKKEAIPIAILIVAFAAAVVLGVSVPVVILACGAFGALYHVIAGKKR